MEIVMGFEFIILVIIPSERGDLRRDFRQRQWRLNGIREKEIRQTDILMFQAKFTSENIPRRRVISYDGY